MKHRLIRIMTFMLTLILAPTILGQSDACPSVVSDVLQTMDQTCEGTGRNQVCYGNFNIQSSFYNDADVEFNQAGDIVDVSAFQSLRLSPVNGESNEWGVALMRLQANLPDTLPGQNVTFVLFGDVQMTSAVDPNSGANPMQAFYLSTGIGMTRCNEAPESGLLVQTPKGVGQIQFAMNGMDVSLGSTVFLQAARDDNRLSVSTLDGAAALRINETVVPVVEGTTANLPLGDDLLVGDDFEITSFSDDLIEQIPLDFLDEETFELAEALDDESLADLLDNLENGEAICGDDSHWDCEDLPYWLGGESCPLDEFGEADCEAFGLEWGDEGFGDFDYDDLEFDDFFDEFDDDFEDDLDDFDDTFDDEFDDSVDEFDDMFDDTFDEGLDDLGDFDDG